MREEMGWLERLRSVVGRRRGFGEAPSGFWSGVAGDLLGRG